VKGNPDVWGREDVHFIRNIFIQVVQSPGFLPRLPGITFSVTCFAIGITGEFLIVGIIV